MSRSVARRHKKLLRRRLVYTTPCTKVPSEILDCYVDSVKMFAVLNLIFPFSLFDERAKYLYLGLALGAPFNCSPFSVFFFFQFKGAVSPRYCYFRLIMF